MAWDIPKPYVIHHPTRLSWTGWWRGFSLLAIVCVAVGCGLWFWLKDPRLLLLTFCSVIIVGLLFTGIAGWRLFSYGVDAEHAEGMTAQNDWHKNEWQEWAQSGLDVVDYSYIFPTKVPHIDEEQADVNSEQALSLSANPPLAYLFEELLSPLVVSLTMLRSPLIVHLSYEDDESTRKAFLQAWNNMGLSSSYIAGYVSCPLATPYAESITHWLNTSDEYAKLMIFTQWADSDTTREVTDGAVAWLIAPNIADVPYRCRLHRTMTGLPTEAQQDAAQFLEYQPLAMTLSDLWFNEAAIEHKDMLIIERDQRLRAQDPALNPTSPAQQFITHWLGKPGPATDWFTITLMMLMAEHRHAAQGLVLSQDNSLLLATVSTGVRT